jgi:hypothetical protein
MWPQAQGVFPYAGHQIQSVAGKDGLTNLNIGANAEELVLDRNDSVLYHVKSDSLGKVALVGEYTISPKEPEPDRLDVIEAKLEKLMEMMHHE